MKKILIVSSVMILCIASIAFGEPNYRGYSGAPGSNGSCASSCHGTSGGTIQISAFPEEYIPGQTYEIAILHSGGSSIRQFNGSCRIGNGSENAGVITTGTNTVTYNTSHETNGVHFSFSNCNSGTFNWTAPSEGVGEVRLYIAGLQGGHSGNNSTIVLTSHEQTTGIGIENSIQPDKYFLSQNYPNPFNAQTTIQYSLSELSGVTVEIYDLLGRKIKTIIEGDKSAGVHTMAFDASDLSSGVYFYRIQAGDMVETKRMVLIK